MTQQPTTLPETPHAEAPYPPPHYAPPPPRLSSPFEKTPLLAAVLSVIPGLGNIYNGLYVRGLAFSVLCFGLFVLGVAEQQPALIPAVIFFWLFNILDAYRQATFINYGYTDTRPRTPVLAEENNAVGGLVLGVAILMVGVYGLVRHLFPELDLERIFDYWYLLFLGFGGWLVFRALKNRNAGEDAEPVDDQASSTGGQKEAEEAA